MISRLAGFGGADATFLLGDLARSASKARRVGRTLRVRKYGSKKKKRHPSVPVCHQCC
jgi:hypothetical protein